VIACIDPKTVLETLAIDCSKREKESLLVLDYAFLIRQSQMGEEIDFSKLSAAVVEQFGIEGLKRIMAKAWKKHRKWVRDLEEEAKAA
jgi:hypothetical protein